MDVPVYLFEAIRVLAMTRRYMAEYDSASPSYLFSAWSRRQPVAGCLYYRHVGAVRRQESAISILCSMPRQTLCQY